MSLLKTDPVRVDLVGKPLKCVLCSHEHFHRRKAHLDTALPGGLHPEWHDQAAWCLVCDQCGHILWFLQKSAG
jgi:hypothetical protein